MSGGRMADRSRYKRLEALYRRGQVIEFPDGTVMWVQAMNPLEADNAREEASTARARLVMALKEIGSDAQTKAVYEFSVLPKSVAVDSIIASQQTRWLAQADDKLRDDPEWKEKLEIMDRRDALQGRPMEDSERQLVNQITEQYLSEVYRRVGDDADFERERLMASSDDEVRERWLELYQAQRGDQAAFTEHQATAAWYGARVCDARRADDDSDPAHVIGEWDHGKCGNHADLVYTDKLEYRSAPQEVQNAVTVALIDLNMSAREAKNSASAETSSDSSALQEPQEESTRSTPTETHSEPPGTST